MRCRGPGDDVTIDNSADVVHSDAVTDSINSLASNQPLTLSGGTLSIASASTSGTLTIDGGTLAGAGNLTVKGLVTLTAGTISGSGAVDANAGITINPAGAGFVLDGRTLANAAGQTATWTGTGSTFTMSDGAVFTNLVRSPPRIRARSPRAAARPRRSLTRAASPSQPTAGSWTSPA